MKSQGTILIVDHEQSARDTIKETLLSQGYTLTFANSALEALAKMDELTPDLLLLDVMIPKIDIFEICRRLKSDKKWQHIPIILIIDIDTKEGLAYGLEAGADDFICKPYRPLELQTRVRSMLRIKYQFDKLETTKQLREDMANMIVHDMRTPLNSILGFSELLLMDNLVAPEGQKDIRTIQDQARYLYSFIDNMLMLTKMEEGTLLLKRSLVDVNQLISKIHRHNNINALLKQISLVIDLPPESQQVSLDINLFQRVVDNLISNALKFSPARSTTTLRVKYLKPKKDVSLGEPRLHLQILDEGPGIPIKDHRRIFNKYETSTAKKRETPQMGLGLAFCKMVVEAHQGTIFVGNNQPTGAIFTIEI